MVGIYKITNQLNGKVYIGQSINIEHRWKEHIQEAKNGIRNYALYNAMRKYGIENFSFEIIEECSEKELDEKEVYYIKEYNSYYDGYNSTLGGQGKGFQRCINSQEIYDLWDQGLSVFEINEKLKDKVGHTTIRKYLQSYKNYSVKESNSRGNLRSIKANEFRKNNPNCNSSRNKVVQYDLWGKYIASYDSYEDAERKTGIDSVVIGRVINGIQNQAGGFQWLKPDQQPKDLTKTIPLKFGVIQYDLEGNEINRFLTASLAAKAMNCDSKNISLCCKHQKNRKTACGYKWEYDYTIWNGQLISKL